METLAKSSWKSGFRRVMRRERLLQVVGLAFLASAGINALGLGENIPQTFAAMAAANAGTRLEPVSELIVAYWGWALGAAVAVMAVTGFAEVARLNWARGAALVQVLLMLAYVTLLHRAFPEVMFTDGVIGLALAVALWPGEARV